VLIIYREWRYFLKIETFSKKVSSKPGVSSNNQDSKAVEQTPQTDLSSTTSGFLALNLPTKPQG